MTGSSRAQKDGCPVATCSTCQYIGLVYHDNGFAKLHHCGKSAERRQEEMPAGADFLAHFRAFFDAPTNQAACRYYEERPLCSPDVLALLQKIQDGGDRLDVPYFSVDNTLATKLNGQFVERIEYSRTKPAGHDSYRLLAVGKAELKRGFEA